jgi:hypothetical protein
MLQYTHQGPPANLAPETGQIFQSLDQEPETIYIREKISERIERCNLYKTTRKNQKDACLTYHIFLGLTNCILLILVSHFDDSLTAQVCTTCCPSRHLHRIHLHHLIHQNHLDPGSTQRLSYGGFKTDSISFGKNAYLIIACKSIQ